MKALILASALLLAVTSSFAAEETPSGESVEAASSKHKNHLFIFKTKKKFVGATVEIYSSNGSMITSQHLQKRKMIISFLDARYDTYTIRIAKGNSTQEFHYVNK